MIASDQYDVVLGSRILGRGALAGGMPRYKYVFNRLLTLIENILVGRKLSEYHTGYRAWSRRVLEGLPIWLCSEDFVFDNEMLAQSIYAGFRIGEISCPTKYFPEASSINFRRSVISTGSASCGPRFGSGCIGGASCEARFLPRS